MMSQLITNSSPNSSPLFLACFIGKGDEMMSYIYILYIMYIEIIIFFISYNVKKKKTHLMVTVKKQLITFNPSLFL